MGRNEEAACGVLALMLSSSSRTAALLLALLLAPSMVTPLVARSRTVVRPSGLEKEVDVIAAAALQRPLPGFTVAASRDGRGLIDKGYGFSNVETSTPAWSGSVYQIGSITKQFTAAAILRLQERGALSIEDEITKWVPDFPVRGRKITLRHLLNHTSGVPNYTNYLTDAYKPMTPGEIYALAGSRPVEFEPGDRWAYNNTGYHVLGVVIEKASGKSYGSFLREEFFTPIGMTSTSYCGESPNSEVPAGYIDVPGAKRFTAVAPANMSLVYAAGGICSTSGDLLRWNDALHEGRVLKPASYEAMTSPAILNSGQAVGYGFGLGLGSDAIGGRSFEHGGSVLGFQSYLVYYPDYRVSVVSLVNITPLSGAPAPDLGEKVAEKLRIKN
jgi:D-alanyl-D-alanine carboxypeptidase